MFAVQVAFAAGPTEAYTMVAGDIFNRPEALLLDAFFACAQRHLADVRRFLPRYLENDARDTQTVPLLAPLLTRSHDATPICPHRVVARCK